MTEAIFGLDVQTGTFEDAVREILKRHTINVVEFVGGDNLHISHQEGRTQFCIGRPFFNAATG
jgi:hypothetical protein|nr:hypothetical protein [uncultured Boseongicola sp.]